MSEDNAMKKALVAILALALVCGLFACKRSGTRYVHVGPNWSMLNDLETPDNGFSVRLRANDSDLALDDELVFTVKSKRSGRLWIVEVDPEDEMTVIFPNAHARDNWIGENDDRRVPSQEAGWSIHASPPRGDSIVAAIVTTGNLDLDSVLYSGSGKSLRLIEDEGTFGLDKLVIHVK